ncbi:hypothetical protein QEH56_08590 [Pelagicoccus enzymogenes]|uniref:hypothetical protein n=1 Tax=Pelagicoccus enzymogenes TaxID=2773457 RepID=UPI00280DB1A9|nr:hypothetical protein [Pelagicoccus enzymogenes]MDQ8198200.1 hypothetical protein [Pelagicoccus enzymogenes]
MKYGLLHILGCLVPIALVFTLPALGVDSGVTFTVFLVLMFACHIFMMGGHSHGEHEQVREVEEDEIKIHRKGEKKSCH